MTEVYLNHWESEGYLNILANIYGQRWRDYRDAWDRAGDDYLPEFPLTIDLELTNSCNLKCIMCQFDHSQPHKVMSDSLLAKLFTEAHAHQLPALFIGSACEPLMHPDIDSVLSGAQEAGIMDVILSTNGTLLTEKVIYSIYKHYVSRVFVSIDAASPKVYKQIRGSDLLKLEDNIFHLWWQRPGLPYIRVSFVKMRENESEMLRFLTKWKRLADAVDLQTLMVKEPTGKLLSNKCQDPFRRLTIGVDGSIYPCCTYCGTLMPIGNLSDISIEEAWNSKEIQLLRESFRMGNLSELCVRCLSSFMEVVKC